MNCISNIGQYFLTLQSINQIQFKQRILNIRLTMHLSVYLSSSQPHSKLYHMCIWCTRDSHRLWWYHPTLCKTWTPRRWFVDRSSALQLNQQLLNLCVNLAVISLESCGYVARRLAWVQICVCNNCTTGTHPKPYSLADFLTWVHHIISIYRR